MSESGKMLDAHYFRCLPSVTFYLEPRAMLRLVTMNWIFYTKITLNILKH